MRQLARAFAWLVCVGLAVACEAAPPVASGAAGDAARTRTVHVVSNGWHTAIVVPRAEMVATGLLPEAADFPDAAYLEFGWGDRVYYPAEDKTLAMALNAAVTGSPAVMHMAGLAAVPTPRGADAERLAVALTDAGFDRLAAAIAGDFKRQAGARARPLGPGLYADSHFYDAHGSFHLFNTCNRWTADKLLAAGVKLSPAGVVTADGLMDRLRAALAADR